MNEALSKAKENAKAFADKQHAMEEELLKMKTLKSSLAAELAQASSVLDICASSHEVNVQNIATMNKQIIPIKESLAEAKQKAAVARAKTQLLSQELANVEKAELSLKSQLAQASNECDSGKSINESTEQAIAEANK